METNEHHKTTYLEELSASDFEVADKQPDINGWEIVDPLGNELGEVEDLIFDSNARKVRYLVANLDLEELESEGNDDYLVLIPIGIIDLDEDEEEVVLPEVSIGFLATLPRYTPGKTISPAEELALRYAFLGQDALPDAETVVYETHPDDFYTHKHFDDARFRKRNNRTGNQNNL
ncbi:PRC-barrel domain-containing protein [Pedobacter sp. N36a]|uniref:PRC-barrel domain-containing protein n=1 Tax=Pedobacter sp. N36a TaxID=2767996 RepID=UPI0016570CF8|nr:PRC-barrel domain-containing protein [Pedobacter sp. N36a]MBC8984923.1 PRC-barrel domain-containing protein [Pedobacter sp. N36a]